MLPVPIVRRVAVCGATGPRRSAPSGRQRRLGITSTAAGTACRALVLHDREVVVDLIRLTLNHGVFDVRAAANLAEAVAILADWRPDMSVVDMDHRDSAALLALLDLLGESSGLRRTGTPVLG